MVDPRAARFWQIAIRCGLIEPAKLEECWNAIPADKRTPDAIDRRLARQAVNSGYLTLWQAQQILAGRQHGLRIERYVLLDQIGHGGMGRVFLARDTRLGRHVAVKVLSRERMSNPRALARFKREGKVGAQLQHENLVRIYDEGDIQGMPYLVMEYIVGQTVAQLIADQGRIEPEMAAELGRQVALGLDHLHQKGLLHRDVNPTNILIDRGGTAKLTDLGLAIDLGDAEDVVTRDGATVGTFDYISPEQARNPRQIDTRSDIYSLGCTLYHMLSGRVPFPAPSLPEKLFAHQSKDAEPLVGQVAGLPDGLGQVVRKMMSKKPEERYARPSLVARALESYARPARQPLDEPSTPRQRPSTSSSIVVGDASRGGSDPDLAIIPIRERRASPDASSDPFEFMKLDLGPDDPLSETRSSARSRSQDRPAGALDGPWPWVVACVLVGLLVVALIMANQGAGPTPLGPPVNGAGNTKKASAVAADISVQFEDGTTIAAASLQDAVRRATGKAAKVVLRNTKPISLSSIPAQQLKVANGRVTIEAAPGTRPVIEVLLNAAAPALSVASNASLTLRGLTFVVERRVPDPNVSPAAVYAAGNLRVDQCALVVKGPASRARAVFAEGNRLEVIRCFVMGFETPIEITSLGVSDVRIEQSILVSARDAGAGDPPNTGWCTLWRARAIARPVQRRLVFDHCTFVGAGLVRLDGPLDKVAVSIEVSGSVVVGQALAMWPSLPFPSGMKWVGTSNVYSLSNDALVLQATGAGNMGPAPTDLKSWSSPPAINEVGSQERILHFAAQPNGAGTQPSDYKIVDADDTKAGADPSVVASPAL